MREKLKSLILMATLMRKFFKLREPARLKRFISTMKKESRFFPNIISIFPFNIISPSTLFFFPLLFVNPLRCPWEKSTLFCSPLLIIPLLTSSPTGFLYLVVGVFFLYNNSKGVFLAYGSKGTHGGSYWS